ncbi:MAG: 50S ribosomal protein L3 [Thermoprotei archaeon]
MGHRKLSSPRRGSAGLRPRKRAQELLPTPRSWPALTLEKPTLLGFVGYKVGMTHVIMVDDKETSPNYGKEVYVPVSILETPPIVPLALRVYVPDAWGEPQSYVELWGEIPQGLRIDKAIGKFFKSNSAKKDEILKKIEAVKDRIAFVRAIVATQPHKIPSLGKKKPDLVEIQVDGGSVDERINYLLNVLGKEISVEQVFKEGQLIDIIGVTKGKGFAGVIKRYGVVELPRWHKHRKGSRKVGARGPSVPTPSYVPQPGKMGFHRRTEYNKRILKIGTDPNMINPAGGFPHYGLVRNTYLIVEGSVIGAVKRPLFLRYPIRPTWTPKGAPDIRYIDLSSKQG